MNFLQINPYQTSHLPTMIGRIISCLDPNKAHGHDMMSIRMLKICGDSFYKLLGIIFRACSEYEILHFFQDVAKSLKVCFTATCFLFSLKTTRYLKISPGLNQVTPALTSSSQSPLRSINPLMMCGK